MDRQHLSDTWSKGNREAVEDCWLAQSAIGWASCWMWFLNQPSLVDCANRANSQNSNRKLFPLGWWGRESKNSINLYSHMWFSAGVSPWMNYMRPEKLMLHTWGPSLKGKIVSERTPPGIKELCKADREHIDMVCQQATTRSDTMIKHRNNV